MEIRSDRDMQDKVHSHLYEVKGDSKTRFHLVFGVSLCKHVCSLARLQVFCYEIYESTLRSLDRLAWFKGAYIHFSWLLCKELCKDEFRCEAYPEVLFWNLS